MRQCLTQNFQKDSKRKKYSNHHSTPFRTGCWQKITEEHNAAENGARTDEGHNVENRFPSECEGEGDATVGFWTGSLLVVVGGDVFESGEELPFGVFTEVFIAHCVVVRRKTQFVFFQTPRSKHTVVNEDGKQRTKMIKAQKRLRIYFSIKQFLHQDSVDAHISMATTSNFEDHDSTMQRKMNSQLKL